MSEGYRFDTLGNPRALYDQYSHHTYVSVNQLKKEMTVYFKDGQKTYPIGELLMDFLYIPDHEISLYEQDRQELIRDIGRYDRSIIERKYHYLNEPVESYLKQNSITVDDYAKKAMIYDSLDRNRLIHPYLLVMDLFTSILPTDNDKLLHEQLDIITLREKMFSILSFCFDTDTEYLNQTDPIRRYYYYIVSGRGDFPLNFKTKLIPFPQVVPEGHDHIFWKAPPKEIKASELLKIRSLKELQEPQAVSQGTVEALNSMDIRFEEVFEVNSIPEIAFLELYQLLLLNYPVKKCALCGRYFVVKGNYGTKYCDRIVEGKNKTCQQIGSTKDFQKRVKGSPAHQAYMKAYKRMYSRINYKMITKEQFEQWKLKAREKKELCEKGVLSLKDFQLWLDLLKGL